MSRTFQFTVTDDVAAEIEQYVYGKTGKAPAHWLSDAALGTMSKNPLTVTQYKRIEAKYGERTLTRLNPLALPLAGENKQSEPKEER